MLHVSISRPTFGGFPDHQLLNASHVEMTLVNFAACCILDLVLILNHSRFDNLDLILGTILHTRLDKPQPLNRRHPTLDPAEDGVLAIQPGRRGEGDEELAPVGVGPGIGHAEDARAGVLERRVDLVLELFAKDGAAATAGAGRVAALDHEVGDDAVEDGGVVVAAADEGGEVLAGLGGVGGVEFDGEGALLCGCRG